MHNTPLNFRRRVIRILFTFYYTYPLSRAVCRRFLSLLSLSFARASPSVRLISSRARTPDTFAFNFKTHKFTSLKRARARYTEGERAAARDCLKLLRCVDMSWRKEKGARKKNVLNEKKQQSIIHKKEMHDISRLILILYCLASIFKTIIDTILIYSFRYNIKIVVSRM